MRRVGAFAPMALLCAGLAAALMTGPVTAEPGRQAVADPRLGALLGQERAALDAVAPGHVERILAPSERPRAQARRHASDDLTCLARAVYHEARGEGEAGMRAVAEVVLNRTESPRFPRSICGVVYQGAQNGSGCQFSFVCDGSKDRPLEPRAWSRAQAIARDMADGAPRALTDGATHFHAVRVRPHWSRVFAMTAEIGAHRFYRKPLEVATN